MTIIHTYLSPTEAKRLSQRDNDYFRQKLDTKCLLNTVLQKHINRPLLAELRCVLDRQPIARRKTERYSRDSGVKVYNAEGKLIRIENSRGKVIQDV